MKGRSPTAKRQLRALRCSLADAIEAAAFGAAKVRRPRKKAPPVLMSVCVVCGELARVRGWHETALRMPLCEEHDTEHPRWVLEKLAGHRMVAA